jgi:acyl dehydratase
MAAISVADYKAKAGTELGVSDWVLVDQAKIDAFADCTGDHQFIHVDPVRAKMTPFGTTIAHGFLTISLMPVMAYGVLPQIEGTRMGVNYGFNKLRLMAPVKSGKRIRTRFKLIEVADRPGGALQSTTEVTVEIEGEDKPALVAEWVTLTYV